MSKMTDRLRWSAARRRWLEQAGTSLERLYLEARLRVEAPGWVLSSSEDCQPLKPGHDTTRLEALEAELAAQGFPMERVVRRWYAPDRRPCLACKFPFDFADTDLARWAVYRPHEID